MLVYQNHRVVTTYYNDKPLVSNPIRNEPSVHSHNVVIWMVCTTPCRCVVPASRISQLFSSFAFYYWKLDWGPKETDTLVLLTCVIITLTDIDIVVKVIWVTR